MIEPTYEELVNMEYKLIFDYYDKPLSFVAEVAGKNYLFFFISDDQWFITLVDQDVANKLNDYKDLKPLYKYLYKHNKVELLIFDFDNNNNNTVSYTVAKDFGKYKFYLPKVSDKIDFDYAHEVEITTETDLRKFL